jgi:hypothetical protein
MHTAPELLHSALLIRGRLASRRSNSASVCYLARVLRKLRDCRLMTFLIFISTPTVAVVALHVDLPDVSHLTHTSCLLPRHGLLAGSA